MPVIFDIKRFAMHDGPGIRTTVFLKGCPLICQWCHNPESHSIKVENYQINRKVDGKEISMARIYGKQIEERALLEEIVRDQVFFEESGGGVTFSGGEPLVQYETLVSMLKDLGKRNIHRTVDTSGYASKEILEKVVPHTDLFLYDLKLMDPTQHKKYTGVDNSLILSNAELIMHKGKNVVFRVPVIPGINDTNSEMEAFMQYFQRNLGKFSEVHLLPYHKIGSEKYSRLNKEYLIQEVEEPSESHMQYLKNQLESIGVKVIIGG